MKLLHFATGAFKGVRLRLEASPSACETPSKRKRILVVISPTKKGITFAFSRGADFENKYGLLEGVGKVSKNVRMSDLKQVNKTALRYYIKQALAFDNR